MFLLMTVCPNSVFLNRGNHEDFGLCCVYGFQKECLAKYNDVVFRCGALTVLSASLLEALEVYHIHMVYEYVLLMGVFADRSVATVCCFVRSACLFVFYLF